LIIALQNKQAAYAMVKSLHSLPESTPLPDPLPPEPPVPISYLGDLRAQIEAEGELNLARQRDLLFELKRRLKDAESREDAFDLMRLLRGREELLATIAEEIDAILDHRKGERNHPPGKDNAPGKENLAGHDSSPYEIDLNGDSKKLPVAQRSKTVSAERSICKAYPRLPVGRGHAGNRCGVPDTFSGKYDPCCLKRLALFSKQHASGSNDGCRGLPSRFGSVCRCGHPGLSRSDHGTSGTACGF
jgi:hypothetical protein